MAQNSRKRLRYDPRPCPSFSLDPEGEGMWKECYKQAEAIQMVRDFSGLTTLLIFAQENANTGGRKFIVASLKAFYDKVSSFDQIRKGSPARLPLAFFQPIEFSIWCSSEFLAAG
jgi:hypothetical protein